MFRNSILWKPKNQKNIFYFYLKPSRYNYDTALLDFGSNLRIKFNEVNYPDTWWQRLNQFILLNTHSLSHTHTKAIFCTDLKISTDGFKKYEKMKICKGTMFLPQTLIIIFIFWPPDVVELWYFELWIRCIYIFLFIYLNFLLLYKRFYCILYIVWMIK